MAHDVTLLDLLVPLSALLVVLGLVVIVRVLVRIHRRRQAVRAIRARAQMDQWDAAGAVRRRPPTRLEDLLDQHEAAEEALRANLAAEAGRHDDLDGLATEWWHINDRRDSR